MRVLAVIPARFNSTRLPGKPLADICGKPTIQHVFERAAKAARVDDVLVATDDQRIFDVVQGFGGKALLTSNLCASGSERVLEAASTRPASIYINIQGDEPLLEPDAVNQLADELLRGHPDIGAATLCRGITPQEAANPNVVKVVRDSFGNALYFSRSPIPYPCDAARPTEFFGHIGIYAYRADALRRFGALPPSPLELCENLEQLRLLQAGISIRVLETDGFGPAVDTPEDLAEVRRIMRERELSGARHVPNGPSKQNTEQNTDRGITPTLRERLARIRLVITDVDGVLTDGGLYYGPDGEFLKRFHARDGFGIRLLQEAGIQVAALSGRDCPALRARLRDLGINNFHLGQRQKEDACLKIMEAAQAAPHETLFVGDDVPDMRAFALCGLSATVADAPFYVRRAADVTLDTPGGAGAFRELADALLAAHEYEDFLRKTSACANPQSKEDSKC